MAAALKEQLGLESQLIKGRDGVFEVTFEDQLVFSKKATGRFPDPGEVEDAIAPRVA